MFTHGNNRGLSGNNQTTIEYKGFNCLSNFPFNYFLNHGTCLSTQHLCFRVTGNYTFWNTHDVFVANLALLIGDGYRKAIQSIIMDFGFQRGIHMSLRRMTCVCLSFVDKKHSQI